MTTSDGFIVYRLPRSHWHCTLSAFEWEKVRPAALQDEVFRFIRLASSETDAPHLILTGTPGIGKTHLGVAIYRALSVVHGSALVTWLNVPAFCDAVKASYDDPGAADALWEDVQMARRLVVLDDLFGKELTPHEKDHIVTRLFDTAYQNNAALVCTMNPSIKELSVRLPPHEVSRLLALAAVVPMEAKDRRL